MNNVILSFMLFQIIITTTAIFKRRNMCKTVVVEAYRSMNYDFVIGLFWFVLCLFWIYFFIDSLTDISYLIDGEHIKSASQLFDLNYLKNLENYFTEKQMFSKVIRIIVYRSNFFKAVTWVIISSGNSIIFLYRGFQKQKICTNMVMTYGGNYRWHRVLEYSWDVEMKKGNLKYCSLYIKLKRDRLEAKLLNDEFKEVKLRLPIDNKEEVDKFLRENIGKV